MEFDVPLMLKCAQRIAQMGGVRITETCLKTTCSGQKFQHDIPARPATRVETRHDVHALRSKPAATCVPQLLLRAKYDAPALLPSGELSLVRHPPLPHSLDAQQKVPEVCGRPRPHVASLRTASLCLLTPPHPTISFPLPF